MCGSSGLFVSSSLSEALSLSICGDNEKNAGTGIPTCFVVIIILILLLLLCPRVLPGGLQYIKLHHKELSH